MRIWLTILNTIPLFLPIMPMKNKLRHFQWPSGFKPDSPHIRGHQISLITIDSGATRDIIRQSTAKRVGAQIPSSSQSVHQADGSFSLKVVGETQVTFTRDNQTFLFEGLVIEDLDVAYLPKPLS